MMSYRVSPAIDSTGYSPFYIMFGRECRLPLDTALIPTVTSGTTHEQHLRRIIENQKVCRELVKENTLKAQQKFKRYYDKTAATPKFMVRDNVWLYNPKTEPGKSPKLTRKWTGPYYISEKLSEVNFRLRNLATHQAVKSVVHANRLRPYTNPALRPTNPSGLPDRIQQLEMDDQEKDETEPPSSSVNDQDIPEVSNLDNFDLEKIVKASYHRGRLVYLVRYRNETGRTRTEWRYSGDLPEDVRKNFHIKYTFSGTVRKRPSM